MFIHWHVGFVSLALNTAFNDPFKHPFFTNSLVLTLTIGQKDT